MQRGRKPELHSDLCAHLQKQGFVLHHVIQNPERHLLYLPFFHHHPLSVVGYQFSRCEGEHSNGAIQER